MCGSGEYSCPQAMAFAAPMEPGSLGPGQPIGGVLMPGDASTLNTAPQSPSTPTKSGAKGKGEHSDASGCAMLVSDLARLSLTDGDSSTPSSAAGFVSYEGGWENSQFHGQGVLRWPSGVVCVCACALVWWRVSQVFLFGTPGVTSLYFFWFVGSPGSHWGAFESLAGWRHRSDSVAPLDLAPSRGQVGQRTAVLGCTDSCRALESCSMQTVVCSRASSRKASVMVWVDCAGQ